MSRCKTQGAAFLVLVLAVAACSDAPDLGMVPPDAEARPAEGADGATATGVRGDAAMPAPEGMANDDAGAAGAAAPGDDASPANGPIATRAAIGAPCDGDCVARGDRLATYTLDSRCFSPRIASNDVGSVFIACGVMLPGDNRDEARLWALDADGRELWTRAQNGAAHDRAYPGGVAVDLEGGAVMVGDADTPPLFTGESWDNQGFVNRYAADGELIAQDLPVLGARTHPQAVVVADDGDVVVAGNADDDLFVRRYDAMLTPRWTATLRSVGGTLLEGYALTVTPEGDIVVVGHDEEVFSNWRSFAARLDADGNLLWRSTHDSPSDRDMFRLVAVRGDGVTLAAGSDLRSDDEQTDAVIALDADGTEVFRWGEPDHVPLAVLVDENDEVVVVMRAFGPEYPLHLVGLSRDGEETWRAELGGLGGIAAGASWGGGGGILIGGSHRPDGVGTDYEHYLVRVAY